MLFPFRLRWYLLVLIYLVGVNDAKYLVSFLELVHTNYGVEGWHARAERIERRNYRLSFRSASPRLLSL